jgi:hypothetical protein
LCDWHCATFFVLLLETKAKAMQFMLFLQHAFQYGVIVGSIISIFHCSITVEAYGVLALSSISSSTITSLSLLQQQEQQQKTANNNLNSCWTNAKISLRRNDVCVVTVSDSDSDSDSRQGKQQLERSQIPTLQDHLQILQNEIAGNNNNNGGPNDIDLRARISIGTMNHDCLKVCNSLFDNDNNLNGNVNDRILRNDRCIAALEELARGMISLADHDRDINNENAVVNAVYVRIVCASRYNAIDPMYHTDKAPLRGYVTLRGVGTEYMTRTCTSPIEYLSLRTFGKLLPSLLPSPLSSESSSPLRCAQELEFIVMKGDYYYKSSTIQRASACVHRSPPGGTGTSSRRRVIVSFDLADGDDNREWYQVDKQRQWRSGMTQRKSHLVA